MPKYIDADKLILIEKRAAKNAWNKHASPKCWSQAIESFIEDLEKAPAADVQIVLHGNWLLTYKVVDEFIENLIKCPFCEVEYPVPEALSNFCPNCGAKMDGEE